MSRAEMMQAACVGKHGFPTKRMAMEVAKRSKHGGAEAFRCPYCGKFHIGNADRKVNKAARRRSDREWMERP